MGVLDFSLILIEIGRYVDVAGIMAGLFFYKKLPPVHRAMTFYLLLMLLVDRASAYIVHFIPSNHIILPIYSLLELLFFTWFYNYRLFIKPKRFLLILGGIGSVYIGGELVHDFILQREVVQLYQPYCKVVDNFIVIIFALSFLHKKMLRFNETRWDYFWLNMFALVFYCFTMLVFLPFNFMVNAPSDAKFYFWTFNIVLILLFYGFIGVRIFIYGYRATYARRVVKPAD